MNRVPADRTIDRRLLGHETHQTIRIELVASERKGDASHRPEDVRFYAPHAAHPVGLDPAVQLGFFKLNATIRRSW